VNRSPLTKARVAACAAAVTDSSSAAGASADSNWASRSSGNDMTPSRKITIYSCRG
jgi:hypothetical protein